MAAANFFQSLTSISMLSPGMGMSMIGMEGGFSITHYEQEQPAGQLQTFC
ncbi:MAG TPA: hypothetical protein IAB51_03445 [Candidatus Merdivicinus excrementipullorum]|uniref:Uncharacterized protein n=1 Tax=Candidatus Merdivicinus excrementipullorum TaxID=2840867 RepID=A0A9D1JZ34_9FIRM|nr:hypothetical protein [Candidatus Merdivicinus excrementipullorum]